MGLIPRQKSWQEKRHPEIVKKMAVHAGTRRITQGSAYFKFRLSRDARLSPNWLRQTFPRLNGKVLLNSIGTVIGSIGPGTVALFFWGDRRKVSDFGRRFAEP
jgi:hypothetical protein